MIVWAMNAIAELAQQAQVNVVATFTMGCKGWRFSFIDAYQKNVLGSVSSSLRAISWLEGHMSAKKRLNAISFPADEKETNNGD